MISLQFDAVPSHDVEIHALHQQIAEEEDEERLASLKEQLAEHRVVSRTLLSR